MWFFFFFSIITHFHHHDMRREDIYIAASMPFPYFYFFFLLFPFITLCSNKFSNFCQIDIFFSWIKHFLFSLTHSIIISVALSLGFSHNLSLFLPLRSLSLFNRVVFLDKNTLFISKVVENLIQYTFYLFLIFSTYFYLFYFFLLLFLLLEWH